MKNSKKCGYIFMKKITTIVTCNTVKHWMNLTEKLISKKIEDDLINEIIILKKINRP